MNRTPDVRIAASGLKSFCGSVVPSLPVNMSWNVRTSH
jgi:hypothetical protein